jgi:hypothetical protein
MLPELPEGTETLPLEHAAPEAATAPEATIMESLSSPRHASSQALCGASQDNDSSCHKVLHDRDLLEKQILCFLDVFDLCRISRTCKWVTARRWGGKGQERERLYMVHKP